jgi:hypothetical protein
MSSTTSLRAVVAAAVAALSACGGEPPSLTIAEQRAASTASATAQSATSSEVAANAEQPLKTVCADPTQTAPATQAASLHAVTDWSQMRRDWIYADPMKRLELLNHADQVAAQLATDGSEREQTERSAVQTFVLANVHTENSPRVMEQMLPTIAALDRHEGEPVLLSIASRQELGIDVRSAALEVLVDAGWWTQDQVRQWIQARAKNAEELAEMLQQLRENERP